MTPRHLFIFILLFSSICFAKTPTDTTEVKDSTLITNYQILDYINNASKDDYPLLLDSLKKYHTTDFLKLRAAYTKTDNYDPYSINESEFFMSANSKVDSSKYDEAAKIMETLLETNYINLRAHLFCGYIYKQMKDSALSEYHYMVYEGLLNSILDYGDGRNPRTAYIVTSAGDEKILLYAFGMKSNEQQLINTDGHMFDLLKSVDKKTGKEYDIYFNVDVLFKHLRTLRTDN
ncbi:MAG: DUF4919 domain-containing protein [Bacteroidota bacterium]|nr:DUF4919 domain-containing protein [Bacteroidota bacterium]MDP4197619.1 DUF4919 domain-containing protein [Bacteroidota bacterium]